jgi:uncharacterized protein (TIGR02145 family)
MLKTMIINKLSSILIGLSLNVFTLLTFNTCVKESPLLMKIQNDSITNVTINNAVIFSTIIDIGEGVEQFGHCWSQAINPTLEDCESSTTLGTPSKPGPFTGSLSGLTPGKKYYARAYLKSGSVVVYSNNLDFTTLSPTLPVVQTDSVKESTSHSALVGGTVQFVGMTLSGITEHGHCWSDINTTPSVLNTKTTLGSKSAAGSYQSNLTGLQTNTQYFVRAYATNDAGTGYGATITFTTPDDQLPVISTAVVTDITSVSARCGGTVSAEGAYPVTSRGVCWSNAHDPTYLNNHTSNGAGSGSFVSNLNGLTANTTYYVRAYATNAKGIAYGQEVEFKTEIITAKPTVITSGVNGVTDISAVCGGNVTDEGGKAITAKGVCWSLDPVPTLSDQFTNEGGGNGIFTSNLTGLHPLTRYYVCAYATNANGTSYGSIIEFKTGFNCGTRFVDITNAVSFLTVKIGNQCWMSENLNVGTMISGPSDQTNNSLVEKYCYNDQLSNCETYGGLYQWNEMMQYTTNESTQGICPDGWHIPSDYEWKVMEMTIGMSQASADSAGWRGTIEGGKLKAAGTTFWDSPNTGATNSTLFTALPAGDRNSSGNFESLGYFTDYWTSTLIIETWSWYRLLDANHSKIYRKDGYHPYATSVRCVLDSE